MKMINCILEAIEWNLLNKTIKLFVKITIRKLTLLIKKRASMHFKKKPKKASTI